MYPIPGTALTKTVNDVHKKATCVFESTGNIVGKYKDHFIEVLGSLIVISLLLKVIYFLTFFLETMSIKK